MPKTVLVYMLDNSLADLQGVAAKLGTPIKNQRLADIVAHRPQAAVRSLKWLISILDNILVKQADSSNKRGIKLLGVPDLVFGGFQRKYGDVMAAEYMASLVNTVAKYRLVSIRFWPVHITATWQKLTVTASALELAALLQAYASQCELVVSTPTCAMKQRVMLFSCSISGG